jgi:hypothetical protein
MNMKAEYEEKEVAEMADYRFGHSVSYEGLI